MEKFNFVLVLATTLSHTYLHMDISPKFVGFFSATAIGTVLFRF